MEVIQEERATLRICTNINMYLMGHMNTRPWQPGKSTCSSRLISEPDPAMWGRASESGVHQRRSCNVTQALRNAVELIGGDVVGRVR